MIRVHMIRDTESKGGGGKKKGTPASGRGGKKKPKGNDYDYLEPDWDPFSV